ncbi:UDP-glucose dehydrogenase family protein [Hyphomicrobium sp.]|uniref:UDP-glucose dehydrogenase family protein n=1 Tax=Hyphomicrobium sp. TaxID=82 RepID=UPI003F71FA3C
MNVSIVGSGYVGLVTAACLAEHGHRVVCVDQDASKVAAITAGRCPIYEKDLPELVAKHSGGALTATSSLEEAIRESEITLIAVPTPFDGRDIDLSYVATAARQIGQVLRTKDAYHVVVVKSTVVPGTTDKVVGPEVAGASGKAAGTGFGLGMNPEFLSEGAAVEDFMRPDRIVLGGIDERTHDALAGLYRSFAGIPVLRTTNSTAEMIKYGSNALQATMISLANELANICERLDGVDAIEVMRGVHAMKELNVETETGRQAAAITKFLLPGCGFGGSCFPKDLKAITAFGEHLGVKVPILRSVIEVNAGRAVRLVETAENELGNLDGRRIAVLGLAFKPGTDDMREAPSIEIVRELQRRGADVIAFDPVASDEARKVFNGSPPTFAGSVGQAVEQAEAILVVTPWPEFSDLPQMLSGRRPAPVVVDGRRFLKPSSVARYRGIGLTV